MILEDKICTKAESAATSVDSAGAFGIADVYCRGVKARHRGATGADGDCCPYRAQAGRGIRGARRNALYD